MTTTKPRTTVLGLGAMGSALARAFLAAGHPTTVWNRTSQRAVELANHGAVAAGSVRQAVDGADLVVLCVLDVTAVDAVIDAAGDAFSGVDVVNLTSSTPDDARRLTDRLRSVGAHALDGTIMVPTPLIGTAEALVMFSGDGEVFERHAATLRAIAGDLELLGDDPGLAALYDLAMLCVFFNGMTAFLHAVALVGANGVPAKVFLPYADRILDVLRGSLVGLADDADRGEAPGTEDNLVMDLRAIEHIVEASKEVGIDSDVPALPLRYARAAVDAGFGADGFARIVDLLRKADSA